MYELRFKGAMCAKGKWHHFEGPQLRLVEEEGMDLDELEIDQMDWDRDEDISEYFLQQHLPMSVINQLCRYPTVKEKWTLLKNNFMQKSVFTTTALKNKFLSSRCGKKQDIREFLSTLAGKRESLYACGVFISNDDYRSTIITSLP